MKRWGYRRLLRLLWRSRAGRERETEDEITSHIEMRVDDLVAAGMSEEDARREAIRRFGDLEEARRTITRGARRRDRRLRWTDRVEAVRRDVIVALRRMRARPGHSILTMLIFGLGIGLTTVMFTFVDNVLLRPLPFPEPDRLVALFSVPEDGRPFPWVSMGNWYDWDRESRTVQASAIYSQEPLDMTVASGDGAFTAPGVRVYGAFFETLRPTMVAGRAPSVSEVTEDPTLAVVSERFWRTELGGVPLSAGVPVELAGSRRLVVGALARGSAHPEGVDLWLLHRPRAQAGAMRNNINFLAVARLRDGVTLERAEADLSAIADGIRETDPEGIYSYGVGVRPLGDVVVGSAVEYLGMLMVAVVLVLLVACANLAALGFARGMERGDEIAVRRSIGAGRRRLVQQLLTEELLLALAGGLVGVLFAWWGTGALLEQVGQVMPRSRDVGFDGRIAAFGALASIFAGLAAGLPPALRAAGGGSVGVLKGSRTVRGRGGLPGTVMIAGEVALTVLLLTGGGLLLMSFGAVVSRDLGFDPDGVVTVDVALTSQRYSESPEAVTRYWESTMDALSDLSGVHSVGAGLWIPTGGGGTGFIDVEARPDADDGAGYRLIGGDYFEALRIPVLQGRVFDERDRLEAEPVAVVNQAMADELWPSSNPIGQRVRAVSMESYWFGGEAPWRTVVGVVGDVRHYGFESDPDAEMFVPFRQNPWMARSMASVIRVRDGALGQTVPGARRAVRSVDPSLAVDVSTLEGRLHGTVAERRMIVVILGTFGLTALLMASLGIYGVISHAVARRTREMAVRAALGARRARLVRMVVLGALRVATLGVLAGLVLAVASRPVLDALLLDVSSGDPRAYVLSGLCLAVVAAAAALIPGLRAARRDPLEALREG